MMDAKLDGKLEQYAQVALRVGLNLQPGQRLLIRGATLETAPLVRHIAACAYQAGARLVDVMWYDEQTELIRFQNAPRDSFTEYPTWRSNGFLDSVKRGDAILSFDADDPDLLKDQDQELVGTAIQAEWQNKHAAIEYITRNATNWLVIGAANAGWAAKLFPNLPESEREPKLWDTIFKMCRLSDGDPLAAWQAHIQGLLARSDYLNAKGYAGLHYRAPGTDLKVGLPKGNFWASAQATSETGIQFTPNMPTEEVFTMPIQYKTEGVVRASRPLSFAGALIEDMNLRFEAGRVVNVTAGNGEAALRKLIETDEGAARLGEVALVPDSSPVSRSGLLFYNGLFDENAASHLALGSAYRESLQGGAALSADEFAAAGGNNSAIHVDFMIGSREMDVDGLTADGKAEPVMRAGEWAFDV